MTLELLFRYKATKPHRTMLFGDLNIWTFCQMHQSAITLWPLTGEVNNIDHIGTMWCSAGKPWILASVLMRLRHPNKHCPRTSTLPHGNGNPKCHWPTPAGKCTPPHGNNINQSGTSWGTWQWPKMLIWPPNFLDPILIKHQQDAVEQVGLTEAPLHNPEYPKDPLPTSWCQTP